MVMIQYYKDLIATVTYDEVESFISNLKYGCCASFVDIGNMFENNRALFFERLSEQLNKPIEHIVHEMKNAQQPDISNKYIQQKEIQKRVKTAEQYLMQHKLSNENKKMSLSVAKDIAVMHLEETLAKSDLETTYVENVENFLALYYACERLKDLITELEGM
jgi:hypothetical protein